jgi:hypothetical protein
VIYALVDRNLIKALDLLREVLRSVYTRRMAMVEHTE